MQTIVEVPLSDIKPYPNNQRMHSEDQIHKIADSIREFGFLNPIILDSENEIVAGHGRVQASETMGMDKVPVIYADHLTESQIKAFRLADNRLQDMSWFDDDKVADELKDLLDDGYDIFLTGFDDFNDFDIDEEIEEIAEERKLPKMERMLDEHHDYLVFLFDNKYDWIRACDRFDVKRVNCSLMPEKTKIGVGRVLKAERLLELLGEENNPQ